MKSLSKEKNRWMFLFLIVLVLICTLFLIRLQITLVFLGISMLFVAWFISRKIYAHAVRIKDRENQIIYQKKERRIRFLLQLSTIALGTHMIMVATEWFTSRTERYEIMFCMLFCMVPFLIGLLLSAIRGGSGWRNGCTAGVAFALVFSGGCALFAPVIICGYGSVKWLLFFILFVPVISVSCGSLGGILGGWLRKRVLQVK